MPKFEYKVVPAPSRAERVRGIKGTHALFANTLASIMNELGREGWEYQRADTLPCEERSGFTGKTTTFQNMLVFRRVIEAQVEPAAVTPHVGTEPAHSPVLSVATPSNTAQIKASGLTSQPPETGNAPTLGAALAKDDRSGVAAE
ncbi:DUF4177 domain-containing protein [Pseudogemmobacter sp. W21_MBD1_M6]|uniref:DUF4177 domain-containing protein n=1 Tax=Pseudogemmobacter sp. W21_MBD1_M6 TaxID=3240271 RepID=UPI003F9E33F4